MTNSPKAWVAFQQHDPGRGDVERQAQQRRQQQNRGKNTELEWLANIDNAKNDSDGQGNVEREQNIQYCCRQRQHHHGQNQHDQQWATDTNQAGALKQRRQFDTIEHELAPSEEFPEVEAIIEPTTQAVPGSASPTSGLGAGGVGAYGGRVRT